MRLPTPTRTVALVGDQVTRARVLAGSGVLRPYPPVTLARLARTLHDWGLGPAGAKRPGRDCCMKASRLD